MACYLGVIYGNLAKMQDAGLPLIRSLRVAASGIEGKVADGFRAVEEGVSAGEGLVESMGEHPKVFGELDVMLVGAGDKSGNLAESFKQLSYWYDFCHRIKGMILSGMALPFVLLHIAALIDPFTPFVLGKIDLAGYIFRVFFNLGLFYVPTALIFAVLRFTPRTGFFRRGLDSFTLKFPVFGAAMGLLAICRYCRVFYMLFKAGVPISQCAQSACEFTGNVIVSDMLSGGAKSAARGRPVSEGFSNLLPKGFLAIWQIGEETGELENVLWRQVEKTSEKAEYIFHELGQWLPRIVYGLVSLFIIYSIFKNAAMI